MLIAAVVLLYLSLLSLVVTVTLFICDAAVKDGRTVTICGHLITAPIYTAKMISLGVTVGLPICGLTCVMLGLFGVR